MSSFSVNFFMAISAISGDFLPLKLNTVFKIYGILFSIPFSAITKSSIRCLLTCEIVFFILILLNQFESFHA